MKILLVNSSLVLKKFFFFQGTFTFKYDHPRTISRNHLPFSYLPHPPSSNFFT